jgi:hypothetical protein
MANLMTQFASGQTVYAIVLNSSGQAWNTSAGAFETATAAHWGQYAIAMAEQTAGNLTGIYGGSFPTAITTEGVYNVLFRQQSGSSPAASDFSSGMLGGQIFWTGSVEAFQLASSAANSANVAMNSVNISANVASWNGTAVTTSGGLPSVSAGNQVGSGPIAINQNTGGTDNLRYVDSGGNGVEGANILIYLATDWPGRPDQVKATAMTGADGRWVSPAFVQSGTYVAVFSKIGVDGPDVSAAFTV